MDWLRKTAVVSAICISSIAGFEAFRSLPYKDMVGVWTDGYGNTHNVVPGRPVTKAQATATLEAHIATFTAGVVQCLKGPVPQGMLDGFVSLAFNIGVPAFCGGSIPKAYLAADYMEACRRILRYDKARVNGKLVPVRGLALRRYAEYNSCLTGVKVSYEK